MKGEAVENCLVTHNHEAFPAGEMLYVVAKRDLKKQKHRDLSRFKNKVILSLESVAHSIILISDYYECTNFSNRDMIAMIHGVLNKGVRYIMQASHKQLWDRLTKSITSQN